MFTLPRIQKISVFIVIGIFLGTCLTPITNGNENTIHLNDNHTIGIDIATKVASGKLFDLNKNDFSISKSTAIKNDKGETLFYIFDLYPKGYLIVSSSYDLPPVIAYSFTSNFQYEVYINPLYDMLFTDILLRLENVQKIPQEIIHKRHLEWNLFIENNPIVSEGFEQWPPEGTSSTDGWLETSWTQNEPYNNFCPLDKTNGGRSIAGCPSIAMAMILDYYKTTNNVIFNDSDDYHHIYGGNNYWIDNDYDSYDFPSFPILNEYLKTLNSHYQNQTPITDNDVAALTFACGVAAKQVYGSDGSGTFSVDQAFAAYKKFQCTTCILLRNTDSNVYGRLAKNMIEALPAHLAIVDESWTSGHNLVVDGYNTKNFYHLNFGWGGAFNAWYLLPDDIPYGLTVLEGVIVDIMYDHVGPQVRCNGSIHLTNVTPYATITQSFSVENSGSPGSLLQWEITSYPDWGTWTFTPSSGTNLTPEQGPTTINVSMIVPEKQNREFSGYIKVTNTENPTDCHIVPITLSTLYKPDSHYVDILHFLMERFPNLFSLLRIFLNH